MFPHRVPQEVSDARGKLGEYISYTKSRSMKTRKRVESGARKKMHAFRLLAEMSSFFVSTLVFHPVVVPFPSVSNRSRATVTND